VTPRTLRWVAASTLERCAAQMAAACSAWARGWTGLLLDASVRPCDGGGPGGTGQAGSALQLPGGERVAVAGTEGLAALWSVHGTVHGPGPQRGDPPSPGAPAAPIAAEVRRACEANLLQRLLEAVTGAPATDAVPTPVAEGAGPPLPAYGGGAAFVAHVGPLSLSIRLSGEAVAHAAVHTAPAPPLPALEAVLDAALLRQLASRARVRGSLRLADLQLPIGALMGAEVGDVILLGRGLDAEFEWNLEPLGLRLPAQLVRTGGQLALELTGGS
jgi:hypothetical protein